MPPRRRTERAAEPVALADQWRSQWGLQFESTNGDVHALERAFWESRAASHQATAAVLSAGAAPGAPQPLAGRGRAPGVHGSTSPEAGGCCGGPPSTARPPPPPRFCAGVALVHGLLAFKLNSQGQNKLVRQQAGPRQAVLLDPLSCLQRTCLATQ